MKGRIALLISIFALVALLPAAASAQAAKDVTFVAPMHVGATMVPAGKYKAILVEEAGQKTMVLRPNKGAEFHLPCSVQPLPQKAVRTEQQYNLGKGGEYILVGLVFEGEAVRHVFR